MWYRFSKKKYDSAIIALWFEPEKIKQLKIKHNLGKEGITQPEDFHMTMMYIGDLVDIKGDKKLIERSIENLAKQSKPFKLKVSGVAKFFTDKDKNPYVFICNAPEIEPLRSGIVSAMGAIGIEEAKDALPFVPHVTLGFVDESKDLNSIDVSKDEILVNRLCVSWGGDLKHFDFGS